jgi:cytochrome c oxidase subunit 2
MATGYNMTKGVTEVSEEIYDLHMLILAISLIIAAGVYGVMIWSIIHHRKSKGHQPVPFHENTTLEITWTIVPLVILVVMAVPATKAMVHIYDTKDADITIKVTGYQWKWEYEYMGQGVKFFSNLSTPQEQMKGQAEKGEHYLYEVDNPLVLPVGKKVRFLFTAKDVLHAWWVPVFGWKQDAVPGFINENWAQIKEAGTYRGSCTELCGRGHGYMPIVVEAKSEAEYGAWLKAKKSAAAALDKAAKTTLTKADLMKKGQEVYKANCAPCHQEDGKGITGTFPAIADGKIAKSGKIADHIDLVLKGKAAMPPFGEGLKDVEIAAVITYERNAFGNNTGDLVQPKDIIAARGKK